MTNEPIITNSAARLDDILKVLQGVRDNARNHLDELRAADPISDLDDATYFAFDMLLDDNNLDDPLTYSELELLRSLLFRTL